MKIDTIHRIIENLNENNVRNNIKLLSTYQEPSKVIVQVLLIYVDLNAKNFEKNFIPLIEKFGLDLEQKESLITLAMEYKVNKLMDLTIQKADEVENNFNFKPIKTKYLEYLSKYDHIDVKMFRKTKEIFKFQYEDLKVFEHLYNIKNPEICKEIYEKELIFTTFSKNADFQIKRIKTLEKDGFASSKLELKNVLAHIDVLVQSYLKQDPSQDFIDSVIKFFNRKYNPNNDRYDILVKTMEYNLTKNLLDSKTLVEKPIVKKMKI